MRNNNVFIDIDVSKWPLARNENLSTIGTKYPEYSNIHTDIASKYGIDKQFICLTSGAEEAVRICLSTINTSNRVQCSPTYGLVPIFNNIYSKKIKDIPYIKTKTAIIYDTDTISKSLDNVDLIYLSNPNSPTGSTLTKTYISNLVNTYINTLFIIDETYIEFADRTQSIIQLVNTHSNLVVIRSFSKFYGLAASRAGFYATSNNILQQLRPVNPISSNTIKAIEQAYYNNNDLLRCNYNLLCSKLKLENYFKDKVKVFSSKGNFIVIDRDRAVEDKLYKIALYTITDICIKLTIMPDVDKFIRDYEQVQ